LKEFSVTEAVPTYWPKTDVVSFLSEEILSVVMLPQRCWGLPYDTLSGGEKSKCDVARALTAPRGPRRPFLLIDEFTSVMDRSSAKALAQAVYQYIIDKGAQGTTLLTYIATRTFFGDFVLNCEIN
jgi:alpha-D-ribose 1-methylphosphonate 5-triphosphate synthase subunit PhnL